MNSVIYQEFIDSIKPVPAHIDIINGLCDDMDIQVISIAPYHKKLWKLGHLDMDIMTVSLTTITGKKVLRGNSINQVYNQILYNFKKS